MQDLAVERTLNTIGDEENVNSTDTIISLGINHDTGNLSVVTRDGYRIFTTQPQIEQRYFQEMPFVGSCELLLSSSLVAIIGTEETGIGLSRKHLYIFNKKTQSVVCELTFANHILAVKASKKRLAIVFHDEIHLYDISTLKVLQVVQTFPNPHGICALSYDAEESYLVFPCPRQQGHIQVFDALRMTEIFTIKAFAEPISQLVLNKNATMLAAASTAGKRIRVHSLEKNESMCEFLRGNYRGDVHCLAFSENNCYLSVTSSRTVHLFKIEDKSGRGCAQLRLPSPLQNIPSLCTFNTESNCLMIASYSGEVLYIAIKPKWFNGPSFHVERTVKLLRS